MKKIIGWFLALLLFPILFLFLWYFTDTKDTWQAAVLMGFLLDALIVLIGAFFFIIIFLINSD